MIENEQGNGQRLRNLRRIQPFLNVLEKLSKLIESLCHDKTYINYIWVLWPPFKSLHELKVLIQAPIKILLPVRLLKIRYLRAPILMSLTRKQIADEYVPSFEKLIEAYSQIANHLPQFGHWSEASQYTSGFSILISSLYTDLLEFHRETYRLFRRCGKSL